MAFKVGQKVVALKSTQKLVKGHLLVKGEIYTCLGYSKHPASIPKNEILLQEHYHGQPNMVGELYCCAPDSWFRPLDYDFVEKIIKEVTPNHKELSKL